MAFSNTEDFSLLTDAELLARSASEPELFALLVRRYEAPLLRRAKAILYSPEDAEEAVQDAFTRMYLYAGRYKEQEGATFSSWAYMILNRVCFTRYRKRVEEMNANAPLDPETYEGLPDEKAAFLEDLSLRSEVLAALSAIPEEMARVLRLQFLEGKTQEEIADETGTTVPAVKTRVHRAKKLSKKAYDSQRHE